MRYFFVIFFCATFAFPAFALTPNDFYFSQQWYLKKMELEQAWDSNIGSTDVVVAILDTGFDMDHPDLVGNVWVNGDETAGDGIDNDKNGYIDDVNGYDFVDDDASPIPSFNLPYDDSAIPHGTVIAGIIGAVGNNANGIAGINWHVRMMNLRILDNNGIGGSVVAKEAIQYAVANGANVINLSFTGFEVDPSFKDAIKEAYEAGVVIVAAVGNTKGGGINVDDKPIYPACHGDGGNADWVIGVASSDENDTKSDFSNYGSTCTDISAPGENIFSTTFQDDNQRDFSSAYYANGWAGTSMAVPMVAGAAALLKSSYPILGPSDIETILRLSASPVISTGDAKGKVGTGRLNIAQAFVMAPSFAKIDISNAAVSVEQNSLIKLSCVGETKADDPCRAVYFYASDGKRHSFPNDKVFFTWFDNFNNVKEVSSSFMSSLQLGKNVTYHPGTKMVKFQTVPTVYTVSKKGELRAIASEQIATELYGSTWNKQIDDISDAFVGNYTFGLKINSTSDYDVATEKKSVAGLDANF
ncbi:S8 family serine peptidase [Candidatus Uhrbacteria bacterium]|nr:S8 family serine peptidase [Candidatus Uhrbacteria bacterium]